MLSPTCRPGTKLCITTLFNWYLESLFAASTVSSKSLVNPQETPVNAAGLRIATPCDTQASKISLAIRVQ
jgi:hypothetical protein